MHSRRKSHILTATWFTIVALSIGKTDEVERAFRSPPAESAPWCYWYWISDNVSTSGLTRDLEAMARVGIRGALMGHIFLDDITRGEMRMLSEDWWRAVEHAVREGERLGIEIGLFNCPGWSQSGGPWITPSQAMRRLAWTILRVSGPDPVACPLPPPTEHFQDLAVLAWPHEAHLERTLSETAIAITASPNVTNAAWAFDGRLETAAIVSPGRPADVVVTAAVPFVARSLLFHPAPTPFRANLDLFMWNRGTGWSRIAQTEIARHNLRPIVGYWTTGPVALAFESATSPAFRVTLSSFSATVGISEIEIRVGPRLERFVEKQLAKMYPDAVPLWHHYRWPPQADYTNSLGTVEVDHVLNITECLGKDGWLRWTPPPGEWNVARFGMAPTMVSNHPAAPEARGLEVDKMNRGHVRHHFRSYVGRLLERMPAHDRRAFRWVVADSYETGPQNWTDGLRDLFRERYGYDPMPWLPTLTGQIVGSPDRSDRFLWDLRRLIADRIATEYVGGLRSECEQHGLRLWLENYGHWGFPSEFLLYGGESHEIGGEFWAQPGGTGAVELRAASSAAAIYGRRRVSAEAFTSVLQFESTPASLKPRGDWAVTQGINHWVLHVYNHQPWDDRRPGVTTWFSTEFHRHTPWFEYLEPWITYWRRIHAPLQIGRRAADIALFIGEDVPVMTGPRANEIPAGYEYDFVNADVLGTARIRNGRWTLRSGASYALLVLPPGDTIRPATLTQIRDLVQQGGTLWGPRPTRSPSLVDWPNADLDVQRCAAELWGDQPPAPPHLPPCLRTVGRGRVLEGGTLAQALQACGVLPAVTDLGGLLWTHRTGSAGDVFFLSHPGANSVAISPWFRVGARLPEIWNPVHGTITTAAVWRVEGSGIRVGLRLEPYGSRLVVFRSQIPHDRPSPLAISRNDSPLLSAHVFQPPTPATDVNRQECAGSFTMTGWARPTAETGLPTQMSSGVYLQTVRNDAIAAVHGDALMPASPAGAYAGVGVSIGTNGIVVWEHGANHFAPVLVHQVTLTDLVHVAVVYRDRQPELWLNGRFVQAGMAGPKIPVPSIIRQTDPLPAFRGDSHPWIVWGRSLTSNEIAQLNASPPWPIDPLDDLPSLAVGEGVNAVCVRATRPGRYVTQWQDGAEHSWEIDLPAPVKVAQGWSVELPPAMGARGPFQLDRLMPLNEHTNAMLRYCAGLATWRATFEWRPPVEPAADEWWLDLGRVEAVAEVRLNGEPIGVLWTAPYTIQVTERLRPGLNLLEVRVAGTWRNRLIGHLRNPNGLPGAEGHDETPWWTQPRRNQLTASSPLQPYGLIGPVVLRPVQRLTFRHP